MKEMNKGRLTIPTDTDIIKETIDVVSRLGADAIRDCDGTEMPVELLGLDVKVYSTYYTTRKDNEWAKNNPSEVQQIYVMTERYTAMDNRDLCIPIMEHFYHKQLKPNTIHDIKRWWEVIDRTTGRLLEAGEWSYDGETEQVVVAEADIYHEYTVSFLAFIIWDPVHMYNAITNGWKDTEHQMTYDLRLPKTREYAVNKLHKWLMEHPDTDIVRFTTFFHQFTLVFDEYGKEKYVDWFGYSASVSPHILEQFEEEVGYRFRAEYIVDQGYHNNPNRIPSVQFKDFMEFQQREVAKLVKVFVDICHSYGKEAMMFLGDHWIGTEPYGKYFKDIGLDAVVGSVGNGTTLRLISDIPGVKYTEGRFLPYFFPDVFHENGDPVKEAKENWVTARRAILRKPIQRMGYGGYLKLALDFPDFMDYIEKVCEEFRLLYENIAEQTPYEFFNVGILNAWGEVRSWGIHMVAHAIDYKQTYSYAGILEALSGMPFGIKFISYDDVVSNPDILKECKVIINAGDAYTAHSGGKWWLNQILNRAVKAFVAAGGGFIGVGEPTACQHEGRFFALSDVLGVDKEIGYSLSSDKYNWEEKEHFILDGMDCEVDFGEGKKNIYAHPQAKVLKTDGWKNQDVQMAVHEFGQGRSVYISGLPYSFTNSRVLYRSIFWAAGEENAIHRWYCTNPEIEINYYPVTGKYCLVNNTGITQESDYYDGNGTNKFIRLEPNAIKWFTILE